MSNRFDRDTQLDELGDGRFETRIDPGWWIHFGPNGGYLKAILLRASQRAVNDPEREPRSFTTHYTARAHEGPAEVVTEIQRSGGSLTNVSARLVQDGRLIAVSLGACSKARHTSSDFQDAHMPEVPPPEALERLFPEAESPMPFRDRYEIRPVFGLAEDSPPEAISGGWIRPVEPRAGDALLLAALCDAWPPALFNRMPAREGHRGIPTVELTVHFRAPAVAAAMAPGSHWLACFRTRTVRDGFMEEDGEIWSPDGVLLAQSRQLAVFA